MFYYFQKIIYEMIYYFPQNISRNLSAFNSYFVNGCIKNHWVRRNHRITHGKSSLPPVGRAIQTASRACAKRWNALFGGLFRHILQALQTLRVCLSRLAKRLLPFRVRQHKICLFLY
jgi:hypothetical protein